MLIRPIPPPYDPLEWAKKPFAQKARMVCSDWALQGYGAPLAIYLVYALKISLYVAGWALLCDRSQPEWWFRPESFQKAIVFSLLFEILGLGCGSGPLTGRYLPPIGGALYFLRPKTTKLPLFPGAPLIGNARRGVLDVTLYAATCAAAIGALLSPAPSRELLTAIAILVALLGVLDKTLFLAARGEHYWTTLVIFALAGDFVPGAKGVHAALWLWAGISKLNHHFPSVVGVMTSNSPFLRFSWLRRRMYRNHPDDLAPSRLAIVMGHAGTALELAVPVVLLSGNGGTLTLVGLALMLLLHTFITSNVPMGVPLEWNFMMVYGGFFLFHEHAGASLLDVTWPVALVLLVMCVLLPLAGNLWPSRVPFLLAMRYYAGNWAFSVWLFKKGSHVRLARLTKSSGWIYDQLGRLYDERTSVALVGKVMAFRLMHLHGRVLPELAQRAVLRLEDYDWIDGEIVAGMVLGWNFGDGHLHDDQLLGSVQAQCGFEPGELVTIMVESQPLFGRTLSYRIVDAALGRRASGEIDVSELVRRQPWGASDGPTRGERVRTA